MQNDSPARGGSDEFLFISFCRFENLVKAFIIPKSLNRFVANEVKA